MAIAPSTHHSDPSLGLRIKGMHCASCVGRVERAIKAVPGVNSVSVNLATERATVGFSEVPNLASVAAAVKTAGYEPLTETAEFTVDKLNCASCVNRAEKAFRSLPGILEANVNLATKTATVTFATGETDIAEIEETVTKAGYPTRERGDADEQPTIIQSKEGAQHQHRTEPASETQNLFRDFFVAAVLTFPVLVLEMGSHLNHDFAHWLVQTIGLFPLHLLSFCLTLLVLAFPGRRFFTQGLPSLLRGAPDMNSLVALGAGAAFAYSSLVTFLPNLFPETSRQVYFESAAVIVTLILLGRALEARARGKTGAAIKHLLGLKAREARVILNGQPVDLPIEKIKVADVVLVRPGENVPLDGIVTDGASFVNESMLTGEAAPIYKTSGATVVGGTLNLDGSFQFRVTHTGKETVLAQIIRMVEQAQGAKLPIQALADKITAWFVPAVLALAALTFVTWMWFGPQPALNFALIQMVSVLIIACPCAMGLATPVSIMVGTGRAAELGILFRKGAALQTLAEADTTAFDKTGTLTQGQPALTDFILQPPFTRSDVLHLLASLEAHSEHPIAKAIVKAASENGLALDTAEKFQAQAGFGVEGEVAGHRILIGAGRYLEKHGIDVTPFDKEAKALAMEAKSSLYAGIDGQLAALLAIADPIADGAAETIVRLRKDHRKTIMVTGDRRETAEAIAKKLGIDDVVAETLPQGKRDVIADLRQSGHKVAFIGDGINDAPALAEADVGVAIGSGTDIAIESADVVLISHRLTSVADALAISRATMRNIRQNLFWAFAYNVILIPVAAGLFYAPFKLLLSPMLAAGAMAFSSVFVVTNALRLRRFSPAAVLPASAGSAIHDQTSGASPTSIQNEQPIS
ncbi:heavy metal translocating P-type ATPase [Beijerinckia mobilis]|uniref:heavy metal translocating P-type ATPase n=1 Tax=Beijerinckia mobilis TaxID=231434 RepID=UPI00055591E3|nr:heavy metal translocating P-type ATPase [Beijerinckia mobilis]